MSHGIFFMLGSYGPLLLVLLSWTLLWNHHNLFFYYTVGLFVNSLINLILKGIIQQPRPIFDSKKVYLVKTNLHSYFYRDGIPFDVFGMPSGHVQTAFFSFVFVYLSLRQHKWNYIFVPITLITACQRVYYSFHSLSQVIVGAITGGAFAYFVYNLAKQKIKNRIREKPDDYAPL